MISRKDTFGPDYSESEYWVQLLPFLFTVIGASRRRSFQDTSIKLKTCNILSI